MCRKHAKESTKGGLDDAGGGSSSNSISVESIGPMAPPRLLMSLPPVARFVNSILSGMNDLRRCLLPGIFNKLRKSLDELLVDTKAILQINDRAVNSPGFRGEAAELRNVSREMIKIFSDVVDPYLRGSLELALGNDEGAKMFHDRLSIKDEQIEEESIDDINKEEEINKNAVDGDDKVEDHKSNGDGGHCTDAKENEKKITSEDITENEEKVEDYLTKAGVDNDKGDTE